MIPEIILIGLLGFGLSGLAFCVYKLQNEVYTLKADLDCLHETIRRLK